MSENIIQYLRITWHFLNGFRDTVQIIVLYSAILYTANGQTGNMTRDGSDWQKCPTPPFTFHAAWEL